MDYYQHKSVQKGSDLRIEKGTFIYRGYMETNLEAIRKNSFEIVGVSNNESKYLVNWMNLASNKYETIQLEELFSRKNDNGSLLIFAENFDSLIERLHNEQINLPVLPANSVPKHLIDRADEIIAKLNAVDSLLEELGRKYKIEGIAKTKREILEEACYLFNSMSKFDYGIYPSSYYDNKNRLKKFGNDRIRFASSLHRQSFNQTQIDKTSQSFIDTIILEYMAGDENRLKPAKVYSKVIKELLTRTNNQWIDPDKCENKIPQDFVEELINAGIPFQSILNNAEKSRLLSPVNLPSRSWFYTYFRWFRANPNQSENDIREKYGDEFYEKSILTFNSYIRQASYPLEYVFVDHCLLDIYIVDEETRSEPYKVWLTVLIDAYSRCILGIALLDESPCIESIQNALKNSIWPKEEWLNENNITDSLPWSCYGYPVNLSMDNAWAHHSQSLEDLTTRLSFDGFYGNIRLVFRPPYSGRYGALIERYFGNIQAQIKELLLGAVKDREFISIRNAKREACLLYSDLLKAIVKLITNYLHEPHSELDGMKPIEKWTEGIGLRLPKIPKPSIEIDRFFWRGYSGTRVINSEGISFFDMHYWSPGLAKLGIVGWDKKKLAYSLSYDVDDISTLAIFQNNHWLCDVKAKELKIGTDSFLKLSFAEMKLAKKISAERFETTTKWLECTYDFKELNEIRKKEKNGFKRGKGKTRGNILVNEGNQPLLKKTNKNQSKDELTRNVAEFLRKS